jgi:hypothetical protein
LKLCINDESMFNKTVSKQEIEEEEEGGEPEA